MKFRVGRFLRGVLCLASAAALAVFTLRAQVVADGATNTLNGVITNLAGHLTVGTNGSFTFLTITNGGTVSNASGFIGYNPSAHNNQVTVTGAGTLWTNQRAVWVGFSGAGNKLTITQGGSLRAGYDYDLIYPDSAGLVVGKEANATNNRVVISDPSSSLATSGNLFLGYNGSGNSMVISNGGSMSNPLAFVGRNPSSTNNSVLVTGSASRWTLDYDLYAGDVYSLNGGGNQIVVSSGGFVGQRTSTIKGSNNFVVATGVGSLWSNQPNGGFTLSGTGSQLVVSNGASMILGASATIQGADHLVLVTGSGSLWRSSLPALNTSRSTLMVTNGGTFSFEASAGFNGNSNTVVVGGMDSLLAGTDPISKSFGLAGNVNRLFITNGGTMVGDCSIVGVSNQVFVNSGGNVIGGFRIGANSTSSNNVAIVTDSSTSLTQAGFTVGYNSSRNLLVVSNGASLTTSAMTVGSADVGGANDNTALITGSGVHWTNTGYINVGQSGARNSLVVSNGANIVGGGIYLGVSSASASSNQLFVGAGSSVVVNLLSIGGRGSGNQLVLASDALLRTTNMTIGSDSTGSSNSAAVFANGFTWTNVSLFTVGYSGSGNLLSVTGGAGVQSSNTVIGNYSGATRNTIVVAGSSSRLANTAQLVVGEFGVGNQLTLSNGGFAANGIGYIGNQFNANSNHVTVTGPASLWTNASDLVVGNRSSFNTLLITNGAWVANNNGYIGNQFGADSNQVEVTGLNSRWTCSGGVQVGFGGANCALLISDGGVVQGTNAVVGYNSFYFNNLLSVFNGTLTVTNLASSAVLDVRRGSVVFSGGTVTADRLLLNSGPSGAFNFNAGTLNLRSATVANSTLFTVGNGTGNATYRMSGVATNVHSFANSLLIASNATLTGNGTIIGTMTNFGVLSPGTSIGKIVLSNSPFLQGQVFMEISKSGMVLTNDQIQVAGQLAYGGSLTVSNLGPDPLGLGNSFSLFSASTYSGDFSSIALPILPAGLTWSNQLALNGTITVVPQPASLNFSGFTRAGTNVVLNITGGTPSGGWTLLTATSVALPLANWSTSSFGSYDGLGNVTLTNSINFTEQKRFFRVRSP